MKGRYPGFLRERCRRLLRKRAIFEKNYPALSGRSVFVEESTNYCILLGTFHWKEIDAASDLDWLRWCSRRCPTKRWSSVSEEVYCIVD